MPGRARMAGRIFRQEEDKVARAMHSPGYRHKPNDMKKLLSFLLLLCCTLPLFSQTKVLPSDRKIKYTGRIDFSDPLNPRWSYSGVTVEVEFTGTSVIAGFRPSTDDNYYYSILDDGNPVKFHLLQLQSDYPLASGLRDTVHHLKLVKLTEADLGIDTFTGLTLDEGESLVTLPAGNGRVIEFIGNSITCGYGDEAEKISDHFRPDQENFYETYAAITARAFKADAIAVCRSGIGIYRNYGGPVTGTPGNMPEKYDRTLYKTPEPLWDFSTVTPEVVCINLGTNDTSVGLFDGDLFTASCTAFLKHIRSNYPDALIVYLFGPMMSEQDATKVRNAVEKSYSELNDPRMLMFSMSPQTGEFGIGGDYHPTLAQHRYNAFELVRYLENVTGWKAEW